MLAENLPILVVVVILVLALGASMIVITRERHVRMIETFGKFTSVRRAGLSLKLPWPIQNATANFSTKLREIGEEVEVKSSDNAFVVVPIRVQYRVKQGAERDAYYLLESPAGQIRSYVVNQVRSSASSQPFNALFQSRDFFESEIERTLTERMAEFGYHIENVLVDDPQPSEDLRAAFDRVISSERLREAATNEAEAERIRMVARANADGEALQIKGEAYARFRKIVAEGNAEALKLFSGETGLGPDAGLKFFTSINEMEALTAAAEAGGKVVFVTGSAATSGGAAMGMLAGADDAEPGTPLRPWDGHPES
ncbi:SPFH domain-containing protein [Oceanicella sp. SM1341]|uniref:SPFH domain-containing protein n=1 Tax=Oceanicella sp. SM1341 TaxID=1548889 RepID=UPI000E4B799A|nr:SPFH domain-containing protein [Oceanicella sp. SM1341]